MSQTLQAQISKLAADLVAASLADRKTLATAESCTGGLIGAAITSAPGSSAVFLGGIIAYANAVKIAQLGVQTSTVKTFGAVSQQVAEEMAAGCLGSLKVDIAISVTGVAGPSGGSPEKPVGTVWVGLATADGVTSKRYDFPNMNRAEVRDRTCLAALETMLGAVR